MPKRIERSECIACGECQRRCPVNAIKGHVNYYEIDENICIECDICQETCPEHAVYLDENNKRAKKKPEKVPKGFLVYINPEKCVSCGLCATHCPKKAISGEQPPYNYEIRDVVKTPFSINSDLCVKCGICSMWCRVDAVYYQDPNEREG